MYENDYNTNEFKEMSLRNYNITIGLTLLWGFAINILMCIYCTELFMSWNPMAVLIGYFVVCLIGIAMSSFSHNPFISFIGYNLVVLPVGVVLSIALAGYSQISIMNALVITTLVTIVMIILASIFPDIFLSMGKVLFVCLSVVIIAEIIFLLFGIITPSLWDLVVAIIFCGYIGYDWAKSQKKVHTLDNAIDSVVGIYLDIINLFIRLLSSSSKSNKRD